jgi:hypothetical protein
MRLRLRVGAGCAWHYSAKALLVPFLMGQPPGRSEDRPTA